MPEDKTYAVIDDVSASSLTAGETLDNRAPASGELWYVESVHVWGESLSHSGSGSNYTTSNGPKVYLGASGYTAESYAATVNDGTVHASATIGRYVSSAERIKTVYSESDYTYESGSMHAVVIARRVL